MNNNLVNNIDLFGWDTVFGISYSKVNEAIKTLKSTPTSFQYNVKPDNPFADSGSINGKWGDWQLSTGGDGKNVTIKCPITSGTFKFKDVKEITFSDGNWIEIELKLEYINQKIMDYIDKTAQKGTGQQQNLVVNNTKENDSDSTVSIRNSHLSFIGLDDNTNKYAAEKCSQFFGDWFDENLDKFEFIFSKFIVNQIADKEDFKWLKPTSVSYAVSSGNDLDTSMFGVMAMTENRTNSDTGHQIDHNLLGVSNGDSAFAFNPTRFAEKFLLRGLLNIVSGTTKDNYELLSDGLTYTNKNKIQWTTFQDQDGKNKTATIDVNGLKLGIENNKIRFNIIDLQWEVKDGITVHVNYTDYYNVSLKSGVDNQGKSYKNAFIAEPTGKPELTMSYVTSEALRNKEIITGVFVGLAGAIVGGLAGGALGGIIDGLSSAASSTVNDTLSIATEDTEMTTFDVADTVDRVVESNGEEFTSLLNPNDVDGDLESDLATSDEFQQGGEDADVDEGGTLISKSASKITTFKNFISTNKWKILSGITIGATVGGAAGSTWSIIDSIAKKNFSDLPTLDEFTSNCVESVKWPNNSGFDLNSATLFTGGLVFGGNLIPESETNLESEISKINDKITSQNLTPKSFNEGDELDGVKGQWKPWVLIEYPATKDTAVFKCSIKAGQFLLDNETYEFVDGDYVDIVVKQEDFKEDQINNAEINIKNSSFSFLSNNAENASTLAANCVINFEDWFNNNLDKVKVVINSTNLFAGGFLSRGNLKSDGNLNSNHMLTSEEVNTLI